MNAEDFESRSLSVAAPEVAVASIRAMPCAAASGSIRTGVILGSGLGGPAEIALQHGGVAIPYQDIPGMPPSAVAGHAGRLVIGTGDLAGVVFMQGRVHYYEGHPLDHVVFGVRVLQHLGIRTLIVTNAAGGICPAFRPGDLMLIDGHWTFLNIQQPKKTCGRTLQDHLWSPRLRKIAGSIETSLRVHEGVYAMMSGPCYETPAEVRMLKTLGVDAVGMSTVPEAIEAARAGIEVLGVSCITNLASGLSDAPLDHAEVSETASGIDETFTEWLFQLLAQC